MTWRDRAEVRAWWALSESDLRVAGVVMQMEPPEWHIACFHAQQAAEKALKALLEAFGRPVPRTHDLTLLAERLTDLGHQDTLLGATLRLSAHGVGPRYPGPSGVATEADARQALDDAATICAWSAGVLERAEIDP